MQTREEIVKQCDDTRYLFVERGYLVDDAEYAEWKEKCVKYYGQDNNHLPKDCPIWSITLGMNENKFKNEVAIYGDLN